MRWKEEFPCYTLEKNFLLDSNNRPLVSSPIPQRSSTTGPYFVTEQWPNFQEAILLPFEAIQENFTEPDQLP